MFLGILRAGGSFGSFLTAPLLLKATDVVAGPPGENPPIPVWLSPGIVYMDV